MCRSVLAGVLGVVLVLAAWGTAVAQGKWTVTQGVGAGPIRVGMTCTAIEQLVTRNPKADQQMVSGQPKWIFYNEGVQVHYDSGVRALQIVVDKAGIPTAEGVQVGDPVKKMEQVYGRNYLGHQLPTAARMPVQYYYVYKSLGLGFQTEADRVILIYVFQKGT